MRQEMYYKGRRYQLSKLTNGTVVMESATTGAIRWFDSEAQFNEWRSKG